MNNEINFCELKKPFPAEDVEWRIQQSGLDSNGKPWALVLAYITNRAIMERLDQVVGPANWKNEFAQSPEGGVLCGLSIRMNGEWVTKWDGADKTQVEATKGGLSNAMKRAGVQWGIGRYLYRLDATFANIHERGANRGSAKPEQGKAVHFRWDPPKLPAWALPEPAKDGAPSDKPKDNGRKSRTKSKDSHPPKVSTSAEPSEEAKEQPPDPLEAQALAFFEQAKSDMAGINTAKGLKVWAERARAELGASPFHAELRDMYKVRLAELEEMEKLRAA